MESPMTEVLCKQCSTFSQACPSPVSPSPAPHMPLFSRNCPITWGQRCTRSPGAKAATTMSSNAHTAVGLQAEPHDIMSLFSTLLQDPFPSKGPASSPGAPCAMWSNLPEMVFNKGRDCWGAAGGQMRVVPCSHGQTTSHQHANDVGG